jgi:hypothetical protein
LLKPPSTFGPCGKVAAMMNEDVAWSDTLKTIILYAKVVSR